MRITDPGGDLKLTKVDVVPMAIEAAANGTLDNASWATSVNGAPEQDRALPAPAEPHYAVYQPTLYLDELRQTADAQEGIRAFLEKRPPVWKGK